MAEHSGSNENLVLLSISSHFHFFCLAFSFLFNFYYTKTGNRKALIDTFVNKVFYYDDKKRKVRYNVTDFSTGSLYERLVELKAAKTHTVLYQINRTEYYCQVDLPLSDYPLYGKQLVASRG